MHLVLKTALATAVATIVWLPLDALFLSRRRRSARASSPSRSKSRALSEHTDVDVMRAVNPEWDYMSRTFTVLGLANRALAQSANEHDARSRRSIASSTTTREETRDENRFLLPYARESQFVDPGARSVFVDGELLMMIAARELIAPRPDLDSEASELAATIEGAMRRSPTLSAESYPNECWTFCNTTALAALAMLDRVHGTTRSRARSRATGSSTRKRTSSTRARGSSSRASRATGACSTAPRARRSG